MSIKYFHKLNAHVILKILKINPLQGRLILFDRILFGYSIYLVVALGESIQKVSSSFNMHAESRYTDHQNTLALESQAITEKLYVKKLFSKFQKGIHCCLKSRANSCTICAKKIIFNTGKYLHFAILIKNLTHPSQSFHKEIIIFIYRTSSQWLLPLEECRKSG